MKLIAINRFRYRRPLVPDAPFFFSVTLDGIQLMVGGYGFAAALGGAAFEHWLYIEFHSPQGITEILFPGEVKEPRHNGKA